MTEKVQKFHKNRQYFKFCFYGFFKNLRFFEPFLLLFLYQENNISLLKIGLLFSIREITRNLFEIPAGILADSLGRKRTMIASFSLYIVSFVVFYMGTSYPVFIVAFLFYSLGDAFRTGTHKAMIFDYLKIQGWEDQKVYYYGHTRSYSQMGSALSALIAAFLVIITGNYRMIFLFAIVPYLLDLVLIISYPKELDGNQMKLDKRKIGANFKKIFLEIINSFRRLKVLKAIANLSVHTGYYRSLKDYIQLIIQTLVLVTPFLLFMEEKQRTAILIGIVYSIIYFLTSLSARNSGRIASAFNNLFKPLNISLLFGLLFGLASGLLLIFDWVLPALIFFILIYLMENLRKPMGVSYVSEVVNKDILATSLSVESQVHTIVAAILAPVIGYFADHFGVGYAIVVVSGFLLLLSPVFLLRSKRSD